MIVIRAAAKKIIISLLIYSLQAVEAILINSFLLY